MSGTVTNRGACGYWPGASAVMVARAAADCPPGPESGCCAATSAGVHCAWGTWRKGAGASSPAALAACGPPSASAAHPASNTGRATAANTAQFRSMDRIVSRGVKEYSAPPPAGRPILPRPAPRRAHSGQRRHLARKRPPGERFPGAFAGIRRTAGRARRCGEQIPRPLMARASLLHPLPGGGAGAHHARPSRSSMRSRSAGARESRWPLNRSTIREGSETSTVSYFGSFGMFPRTDSRTGVTRTPSTAS